MLSPCNSNLEIKRAIPILATGLFGIARVLLAALFIFSGVVKAIDPLGTAYKLQDYFMAAGLEWMLSAALPLSLTLNTFEVVLGAAILFGAFRKVAAWTVLSFMVLVTPLTLYIALTDPVPDCGCFGDAIIISNWETFFKNAVLLVAAGLLWSHWHRIALAGKSFRHGAPLLLVTAGVLGLSLYGWLYLPVMDFRPWRIGQHIPPLLEMAEPPVMKRTFVYAHRGTGERQHIAQDEIMQGAAPDSALWDFVRRDEVVLDPGVPVVIDNFSMHDEFGEEVTEFYMNHPGLLFIVASYDLHTANINAFTDRIRPLAEQAEADGHAFAFLTATSFDDANAFAERNALSHAFYQTDERALKTMIRSNPGLVLLRDGVVIGKWPHRRIPTYEMVLENKPQPRRGQPIVVPIADPTIATEIQQ